MSIIYIYIYIYVGRPTVDIGRPTVATKHWSAEWSVDAPSARARRA